MTRLVPLPPSAADVDDETFDSRWAAWRERGRVGETRTRARVHVVLTGLVFIVGTVLLWVVIST